MRQNDQATIRLAGKGGDRTLDLDGGMDVDGSPYFVSASEHYVVS
jgi:hypothetical protein